MKLVCLIAAFLVFSAQSPSQAPAQHGLVLAQDNLPYPFPVGRGKLRWTGDYLAGCDFCGAGGPILWSVDRMGTSKSVALEIPAASHVVVRDVAAGPDGSLSAVGLAISGDLRMSTFIAVISPAMDSQLLIQAWPYCPEVLAVASDGTIWTVGEMSDENHKLLVPNLLRHYSKSGQLLASTRVQRVRASAEGMFNVSGISTLMMSNDRIGWLTQTCQYIEFTLEAVQTGSYGCPNAVNDIMKIGGVALSAADDLLVQPDWSMPLAPLQLDRATGTWKPVPVLKDVGKTHMVLGFDGLKLVTSVATPS